MGIFDSTRFFSPFFYRPIQVSSFRGAFQRAAKQVGFCSPVGMLGWLGVTTCASHFGAEAGNPGMGLFLRYNRLDVG